MLDSVKGLAAGGAIALVIAATPAQAQQAQPEAKPEEKETVRVDMSKGGLTLQSGDNSLTLRCHIQLRYTADDKEDFDADTAGSGVGKEDGLSHSFDLPRLRLGITGGMFRPWLKYMLEVEFSRTSGDSSSKFKDAYLDFTPRPLLNVRFGQYKVPFSLQELTSDTRQEFPERALTNGKFAPARDEGVMLWGVTESKLFGYGVGVFNGGGEAKAQDDQGLMYVGRIWVDPLGEYKLSETANENAKKPVFHAGLGFRTGEAMRGTATAGVFEDVNNETAWNLELAWRNARLFATGEYFRMTDEQENPTAGPDIDSDGWHAQVGWMVRPKTFDLALRYAEIDPDLDIDNDRIAEQRLGASYFWRGHNLKIHGDVGTIDYEAGSRAYFPTTTSTTIQGRGLPNPGNRLSPATEDLSDLQIRVQVQLAF